MLRYYFVSLVNYCRIVALDPFMRVGTTGIVARKQERNYIGFELNPDYVELAEKRIRKETSA